VNQSFSDAELVELATYAISELNRSPGSSGSLLGGSIDRHALNRALQESVEGATEAELLGTNLTVHGYNARDVVRDFIERFFANLRDILCGAEGASVAKASDLSGRGVATALAAWMTTAIGLANPLAIGIATVTIIVIAKATKNSFCQMTKQGILEALEKPPESRKS
jgi:hypothetical protein